jgi:hypothetical protein
MLFHPEIFVLFVHVGLWSSQKLSGIFAEIVGGCLVGKCLGFIFALLLLLLDICAPFVLVLGLFILIGVYELLDIYLILVFW